MTAQAPPDFVMALRALFQVLGQSGRPGMLIGGLAVVARGVPRLTVDIDAVVRADGLNLDALWDLLRRAGFEPRVLNAVEFARQRQVLLLTHVPSRVPVDLSLGWLEFEWEAIARATTVQLGGVAIPVATPDDLVVLKAVAWRRMDQSDIEELIARHAPAIDFASVRATLTRLYALLDEPERINEFDELVRSSLDQVEP